MTEIYTIEGVIKMLFLGGPTLKKNVCVEWILKINFTNFSSLFQNYRRALELNPSEPQLLLSLGSVHHAMGEWESAWIHYHRCLQLQPDNKVLIANMELLAKSVGKKIVMFWTNVQKSKSYKNTECGTSDKILCHLNNCEVISLKMPLANSEMLWQNKPLSTENKTRQWCTLRQLQQYNP